MTARHSCSFLIPIAATHGGIPTSDWTFGHHLGLGILSMYQSSANCQRGGNHHWKKSSCGSPPKIKVDAVDSVSQLAACDMSLSPSSTHSSSPSRSESGCDEALAVSQWHWWWLQVMTNDLACCCQACRIMPGLSLPFMLASVTRLLSQWDLSEESEDLSDLSSQSSRWGLPSALAHDFNQLLSVSWTWFKLGKIGSINLASALELCNWDHCNVLRKVIQHMMATKGLQLMNLSFKAFITTG